MRTYTHLTSGTILSAAAILVGAGCGNNDADGAGAELVILGDRDITLEAGEAAALEVEYRDLETGDALRGDVEFAIVSDAPPEAEMWDDEVLTDAHGVAEGNLDSGDRGDYEVVVEASAPDAEPVSWEITVEPLPPLDPTGTYAMESRLDVASSLPGRAGRAVNLVIDMTDDNADPTLWILERVQEYLPSWVPDFDVPYAVALTVNSIILDTAAPSFVSRITDLGQDFGDVATNFGLVSRFEITGEEDDLSANHAVTGFVVEYGGSAREISLEDDMGAPERTVTGIDVSFSEEDELLEVETHELDVSYGALLVFILEEILLGGEELGSFLESGVGCETLAEELADRVSAIPSLATGAIESACGAAIRAGADRAVERILEVDERGLVLELGGDAVASDDNRDRRIDALTGGFWDGAIHAARDSADLDRDDASFHAERVDP